MKGRFWRGGVKVGFIAGFVLAPIAMVMALLVPLVEMLQPLLVPGALLLRPLIPAMSGWPGSINVLLAAVANGVVFAVIGAGIALLVHRAPHHRVNPPRQRGSEPRR